MKNTSIALLIALSICALSACDNSEQRARERAQEMALLVKQQKLLEIKGLDLERSQAAAQVSARMEQVNVLNRRLDEQVAERQRFRDAVQAFIMDHKMATTALALGVGGAGVALDPSNTFTQDAKNMAGITALIAAAYALANYDEVKHVGDQLLQAGVRDNTMQSAIDATSNELNAARMALVSEDARLQELNQNIAGLQSQL
jgi:hypothetical protein